MKKQLSEKLNYSLGSSRINRNGLVKGATAPAFCLPSLHETQLCLAEYRDNRTLLVFSDPNCIPCNELAPVLEQLHQCSTNLKVLMISRGDLEANRGKAAEYGLTFPILLQRHWEISQEYEIFATPVGYLIDEKGIIVGGAAMGVEAILALANQKSEEETMREQLQTRLETLKKEIEIGQVELEKVERQRTYLHEMMLRISGAIKVLEELLAEGQALAQKDLGADKKQSPETNNEPITTES